MNWGTVCFYYVYLWQGYRECTKNLRLGLKKYLISLFLLSQGLTFHLLAQVRAPAIPHVLHCQQVLLQVMHQQQGDAGHHQLIHDT